MGSSREKTFHLMHGAMRLIRESVQSRLCDVGREYIRYEHE